MNKATIRSIRNAVHEFAVALLVCSLVIAAAIVLLLSIISIQDALR